MVHVALMTNLLLTIGTLPLIVTLVTTDPARSWPLLALLTPLGTPAVCAAFAVLSQFSSAGSTSVWRTFWSAWRACWRRAATVGLGCAAALVGLGVDTPAAWGRPIGAVAVPVLVVLMVLAVATSLLALVALAGQPQLRVRQLVRACLYLAVRHWYLTIASLLVLVLFELVFASSPAIALGLAAAPLLYV